MSLNKTTGVISGKPTTAKTYDFTIKATDSTGLTGSLPYEVTINPVLAVSPATLPNWTINFAGYNQVVTASGGTGVHTFSVPPGTLPTGLALDPSTGIISGTPTVAKTFKFTVTAKDSVGATTAKSYSITIDPAIKVGPASFVASTINKTGYSQSATSTGGTGAVTFSVPPNTLPPGLSLSTAGKLTGTPTAAGVFSFTITATDSVGAMGSTPYSITINPAPAINTAVLANWTAGKSGYNQPITATGGTGAHTFSVTSGTLPSGLSLNKSTGVISGTPKTANTYNFTITATDSLGITGSKLFTVLINPALTVGPANLVNGQVNETSYSQTIVATGGTGADTFKVSSGSLPAGLALNAATGVISGTPTTAKTYKFAIKATDTVGATGSSKSYTVVITL